MRDDRVLLQFSSNSSMVFMGALGRHEHIASRLFIVLVAGLEREAFRWVELGIRFGHFMAFLYDGHRFYHFT